MSSRLLQLTAWHTLTVCKTKPLVQAVAVLFLIYTGAARGQDASQDRCYPGIACGGEAEQSDGVLGPTKPDFSFTQNFVIDGLQNLIWSRDLYAVGDTTVLFKRSAAGDQSLRDAFSDANAKARSAEIGGLSGWRLAKRDEVNQMLNTLDATTVYVYFRPKSEQIPYRWVFGAFDDGDAVKAVAVDGSNYANTSLGRLPNGQQPGSPELNPYGLWLVREMTPDVEQTIRPLAEELHQYREPVDEQRLKPVSTYSVTKTTNSFDLVPASESVATVSATRTLNSRFYGRYNLKQLPRGALVSAEVLMAPLSWSGSPTPTIKIDVTPGSDALDQAADLWALKRGESVGVWQPPNRARLELPEQIARNAFNVGDDLLFSFAADYNSCQFSPPELIIRFVREENVLFGKQLP